jgi:dihydrofolate reductase
VRSIVVAFAENRGIGYRGQLPWRLPSDLRRFRELTLGGTVLMGRKTYESLPDAYRPLPGRRNVVVSANRRLDMAPHAALGASEHGTSVELCESIDAGLRVCGSDCFVIGGGSVYEQTLPLAERVYATLVHGAPASDTFFPELSPDQWQRSELGAQLHENGHTFRFAVYDRLC